MIFNFNTYSLSILYQVKRCLWWYFLLWFGRQLSNSFSQIPYTYLISFPSYCTSCRQRNFHFPSIYSSECKKAENIFLSNILEGGTCGKLYMGLGHSYVESNLCCWRFQAPEMYQSTLFELLGSKIPQKHGILKV